MALIISTWLWGQKYNRTDVAKLYAGVRRNLDQAFRFILFSDCVIELDGIEVHPIENIELTKINDGKGCFARLRMFDPDFQTRHNINDRLVCIDLDTVITGNLDPVFDRPEPFVILHGANAINPCPYTGALMMLRPGAYPGLWYDFDPAKMNEISFYAFPDDQGWIYHQMPDAAGWKAGSTSGVYAFQKPGWPPGTVALPDDARIVTFIGARKPQQFIYLPWIQKYWIEAA